MPQILTGNEEGTGVANIIEVKDLRTYFYLDEGVLKALDKVSFEIEEHKTHGIIGESGCGKSVTAQSMMRILPHPGRIVAGHIWLKDERNGPPMDLVSLNPRGQVMRDLRGRRISMIFQEPMTSFSPVHTIGNQIMEVILLHRTRRKKEAREIALDMINRVGISNPTQRIDEYPHQLSGGMRQRAMIAMALVCHPALLIADEPTTALDVTVQAQILELIKELQDELGMGVMYITHNLGVVAEIAESVSVMYLGQIVEHGPAREIFHNPMHPYTRRLMKSIPKVGKKARQRLDAIKGNVPVPLNLPWRCGFFGRCPEAIAEQCGAAVPELVERADGHFVRCFLQGDEALRVDETFDVPSEHKGEGS